MKRSFVFFTAVINLLLNLLFASEISVRSAILKAFPLNSLFRKTAVILSCWGFLVVPPTFLFYVFWVHLTDHVEHVEPSITFHSGAWQQCDLYCSFVFVEDSEKISEQIDTLYRIVHVSNFNISTQALMLLYQLLNYRYYVLAENFTQTCMGFSLIYVWDSV